MLRGNVAVGLLCITVALITLRDPGAGPRAVRSSWRERIVALIGVWPVTVLFAVVMGGISVGVFTATEGASIGAFGERPPPRWLTGA